jgi:N-acetylglutamate synthase-like GNAT family acetyltransferase
MNDARFERATAFERDVMRRTSTNVEPFAYGDAYLNEDVPCRYDSNLLWVDAAAGPPRADELVAEADRILGAAGLLHRKVRTDADVGRSLAPRLIELGWTADHLVTMTLERLPDRAASVEVRERGFRAARPLIERSVRRSVPDADEDCVEQLVRHKGLLEERVGARFFVARIDARDAGVCEMYVTDGVAQIEDVGTLEELRGRGAGRAIVLAAAEAARDIGAELIFLLADDEDWPKRLYDRLGFDPVGEAWEFTRLPRS